MALRSKYMTESGVVFDEPIWYVGCLIIRDQPNQPAEVTAYVGDAPVGNPFWKYVVGTDDPRTVRIMRDMDDDVYIGDGMYVALGADTTFIAYFRPVGP